MLQPMPSVVAQSTAHAQPAARDASALRAAPPEAARQPGTDAATPAGATETILAVEQAAKGMSAAGPLFNARLALPPVPADLFGPKPSFKITLLENLRDELRTPPLDQVLDLDTTASESAPKPDQRASDPVAAASDTADAPDPATDDPGTAEALLDRSY